VILHTLCNSCLQPFRILVEPSEIELVKQVTKEGSMCECPRKCGGLVSLAGGNVLSEMAKDPRLKEPMSLTGTQLFKAINGLGLPDEIPKNADVVKAFLKAHKVLDINVEEHAGKFYLHEIQLEGGITLHLSAGLKGAQLLKITKERV
jgi:hypothetical protein